MSQADQDIDALKEQLCSYARLAYERRLATGTGGNLSARAGDDCVLVTPSGLSLGGLEPQHIVTVDMACKVIGEQRGCRPSKESSWHVKIMQRRANVGGIIHLHSPYCVGASMLDEQWPRITVTAAKNLKPCPVVPAATPGSDELSRAIIDAVESSADNANLIILEAHGIVALGANVQEAFHIADAAEEAARTAVIAMRRDA